MVNININIDSLLRLVLKVFKIFNFFNTKNVFVRDSTCTLGRAFGRKTPDYNEAEEFVGLGDYWILKYQGKIFYDDKKQYITKSDLYNVRNIK